MNRRDLFKLFGAGALVAPIVNGMPEDKAIARLIEPPKIEVVPDWEPLHSHFVEREVLEVVLYARGRSGKVSKMECQTFISNLHYFTTVGSPIMQEASFTVTGEVHFNQRAVSISH